MPEFLPRRYFKMPQETTPDTRVASHLVVTGKEVLMVQTFFCHSPSKNGREVSE
jgi:hypothetical protein